MRVRDPSIDEHRVAYAWIERRSITRMHENVWIWGEILTSPARQSRVHPAGRHPVAAAEEFSHDGRMVSNPTAQVVNGVTRVVAAPR